MKDVYVTLRFLLGVLPGGMTPEGIKDWVAERIGEMDLGDLDRIDHSTDTEVK
jgi:hypothetical protein